PCLYVKSFKAWYGNDHDRIREIFKHARKSAPCVVVLEDLDSLIDNYNRSFFLNELDGFAENTGVALIATTNHPDRLDPAILDRPSRFDRKYYFDLPSSATRLAYFERWRETVQEELVFSDETIRKVVARTRGFSFAYMKELCVSAMMAWMADRTVPMDRVLRRLAVTLRDEMKTRSKSKQSGKKRKTN
ncbi:MAG TPA: ATP-binding protein, partial [Blastocatellia bacterium]|nr:ATP-binding protein [Blastocatellia bacterium]